MEFEEWAKALTHERIEEALQRAWNFTRMVADALRAGLRTHALRET